MAVRIRLRRTGGTNNAKYRIVVAESANKRDGRFIEALGHYDPTTQPAKFELNRDRAMHWLSVGAQPSDTVKSLLSRAGVMKAFADARAAAKKG